MSTHRPEYVDGYLTGQFNGLLIQFPKVEHLVTENSIEALQQSRCVVDLDRGDRRAKPSAATTGA